MTAKNEAGVCHVLLYNLPVNGENLRLLCQVLNQTDYYYYIYVRDNVYIYIYIYTVKPVLRGHPWGKEKVVFQDR